MRALLLLTMFGLALSILRGAEAATIYQNAFLTSVSNYNGFEGKPDFYPLNSVYSEGGIDVQYVGNSGFGSGVIISGVQGGEEGGRSWYPNGGANGYTSIKLSSGNDFSAIQFKATTGAEPIFSPGVQFQLLNDGVVVDQGFAAFYAFGDPFSILPLEYFGLSGGHFDELRLQALDDLVDDTIINILPFDAVGYDTLTLDAIAIGTAPSPTPLPPALPLFASTLGGLGFIGWRRRKSNLTD